MAMNREVSVSTVGNGNGNCRRLHAVAFAYPLQGHIIPVVHLTKILAASGVIVTFVQTEACHAHITRARRSASASASDDPFSHLRTQGFDVRYTQVSDGLPVDFDRSLNPDEFAESVTNKMALHAEELILDLNRKGPPISCIIADTVFVWMARLAKKFQIPLVSFWTEPAAVFSIYYHMDLLRENGHYASHRPVEEQQIIDYIPGVIPSLRVTDLPSVLQESVTTTLVHTIFTESFEAVRGADWVICNTVYELESPAVDELQSRTPFWSVGPLLPPEYMEEEERKEENLERIGIGGTTSMWAESDCTKWLDSRPRHSVIYISFGSFAHVSKPQIEEMAMGLVQSKQSFIWVLRPDIVASDVPDVLPRGFLDDTRDQGLVVPWSSQLQVLSHPSVGGFLTHCGWNSILESIWLGIPMLAFPLLTDQYTNCKLITDEWRVAIRLGGSSRSNNNTRALVGREVIARSVKETMSGSERKEMWMRVQILRDILHKAVRKGGSSRRNLDSFLDDLKVRVAEEEQGLGLGETL